MSDQALVPDLLRRESRSYLQYIREAFPWAKGRDDAVRAAVQRIANSEADFIAKLSRLLQKRHFPLPALGAFPTGFTDSNFVAASYLVPKLAAAERHTLADLERDLPRIDDPEFQSLLASFRDLKRSNLAELESLTAGRAA